MFRIDGGVDLEEKPGALLAMLVRVLECWDLLERYSSFRTLLRVTAICMRFVSLLKRVPGSSLAVKPLSVHDVQLAQLFRIKSTQSQHFPIELRLLFASQRLQNGKG